LPAQKLNVLTCPPVGAGSALTTLANVSGARIAADANGKSHLDFAPPRDERRRGQARPQRRHNPRNSADA